MSIHTIHEAQLRDSQSELLDARKDMLVDKGNSELRDAYIRLAVLELNNYAMILGINPLPSQLLATGSGGAFDELVDLYTTQGKGISDALYALYLTDEQRVMLASYPKIPFELDIAFSDDSKFGADVVSFELARSTATVYSIITGDII